MRTFGALLALGLATLAGCGGSDSKSCSGGAACGGTIVPGRYKISSYCAAAGGTQKVEGCEAGVGVDLSGVTFTGTMTFNADKTYQTDTVGSGTFSESFPASCLMGVSCSQIAAFLQGDPDFMSMFSSLMCTGTSNCTCSFTLKPQPEMTSGTYSTAGTTLTLTPTAGAPDSGGYCATPTQLVLTSALMAGMMAGMPEMDQIVSNIVLTKE
ncbi:MAG TPA: hypothetical protein VN914_18515 [Polyangia bacterium]|nr:hypothetical protein [Polyangia bacterium]